MIKVDIDQLNKVSNEITTYLDSYEETLLNLFSKLKDSTNDWNDAISRLFDEAMIAESNESQNFLSELKQRKNIFGYITEYYNNLGRKVKYDDTKKASLISKINSCISECNSIIDEFNRIDNSFYYSEYYIILNQKAKIVDVRTKLRNLKEKINKRIQNISDYEDDIATKISELETFKINEFTFNYSNVVVEKNRNNVLYPDLLATDIKNIEMYYSDENKELNSIFNLFNTISSGYKSSNVTNYKSDCIELKKNVGLLRENREKYVLELNNQMINYQGSIKVTREKFKNKEEDIIEESNGEQ